MRFVGFRPGNEWTVEDLRRRRKECLLKIHKLKVRASEMSKIVRTRQRIVNDLICKNPEAPDFRYVAFASKMYQEPLTGIEDYRFFVKQTDAELLSRRPLTRAPRSAQST